MLRYPLIFSRDLAVLLANRYATLQFKIEVNSKVMVRKKLTILVSFAFHLNFKHSIRVLGLTYGKWSFDNIKICFGIIFSVKK